MVTSVCSSCREGQRTAGSSSFRAPVPSRNQSPHPALRLVVPATYHGTSTAVPDPAADAMHRCWLPGGEAAWIHKVQALEIARPLVVRF